MTEEIGNNYAYVLIPLAIPKVYAYHIPEQFNDQVKLGMRVEVSLRNKSYAGIITEITQSYEGNYKTKDIISLLDSTALVAEKQLEFWKWISEYYCCTLGEVMNVALPQGLKLSSETLLVLDKLNMESYHELSDEEYLLTEALSIREELPIIDVQDIIQKKNAYPVIKSLFEKRILKIKEELKTAYKEKRIDHVRIDDNFIDQEDEILKLIGRSDNQLKAYLAYKAIDKNEHEWHPRNILVKRARINTSVFKALEKKGVFEIEEKTISRIKKLNIERNEKVDLSPAQKNCKEEIWSHFKDGKQVFLHGITGSGKTQIYIELMKKIIENGQQVLYLLPEIGLTTQIVNRLRLVFGDEVGVYHSRMNHHERVEVWQKSKSGFKILLAARSGIFLPMENLGLIIIDEEHDASYKQSDPAPRYNARDCAVYLSNRYNINLLLGTATPSLESYNNVKTGKYALVEIHERFGEAILPDIEVVDLKHASRTKNMKSVFSRRLLDELKRVFSEDKQAILFQNRRGYAPVLRCNTCEWMSECTTCDVKMTVHKFSHELRCHYCGRRQAIPPECPRCGSHELVRLGFGTEKIENEIQKLFPNIKVARLDYDTSKTKSSYASIIARFENGETDLLVGTQMITKGLDFDRVALVAILNADQTLYFPDFRANERAFQLFTQVAGRAGRKEHEGKVIIQSYNPSHPVILETIDYNFDKFLTRELLERKQFLYPPFYNLIYLKLKHKKAGRVHEAAIILANNLKQKLGKRVFGPTEPGISRIRGFYLRQICIKAERKKSVLEKIKAIVLEEKKSLRGSSGFKTIRINIDVDPY